jgi:23S rRNA (uracil1939-C5)-methyltransferase
MEAARKTMAQTWPDEVDLHLTAMAQGGDGVGRWEGRVVFATGGLPGERVRVRLRDRQRSFARGEVMAVLEVAPERVASPCPLEARCGAGDWRFIAYDAQLRFKAVILQDQLRQLGGVEVAVDVVHGMAEPGEARAAAGIHGPAWGYRTTAELHFARGMLG